jgi:hypothetical protein
MTYVQEYYSSCAAACPTTCSNYTTPIACPPICVKGCVCRSGMVRNAVCPKCVHFLAWSEMILVADTKCSAENAWCRVTVPSETSATAVSIAVGRCFSAHARQVTWTSIRLTFILIIIRTFEKWIHENRTRDARCIHIFDEAFAVLRRIAITYPFSARYSSVHGCTAGSMALRQRKNLPPRHSRD